MAIDKVREYFKTNGIKNEIIEFDCSSATVQLAAQAIGCEPSHIAKSLTFAAQQPLLVVAAGDARIDNAKFKEQFGIKAKMLSAEQVIEQIGHAVGGVCPFAVNDGVKVYLDRSLQRFEYVYPACGSSNSATKLTPDELYGYSQALGWVDVCKTVEVQ